MFEMRRYLCYTYNVDAAKGSIFNFRQMRTG